MEITLCTKEKRREEEIEKGVLYGNPGDSQSLKPKSLTKSKETKKRFQCGECKKFYKLKTSLSNHTKWECGKEPQFRCPYCSYKAKQKIHLIRHLERVHRDTDDSRLRIKTDNEIEYEMHFKDDFEGAELFMALNLRRRIK